MLECLRQLLALTYSVRRTISICFPLFSTLDCSRPSRSSQGEGDYAKPNQLHDFDSFLHLGIEHDYHNVHNSVQSLSADWRKIGVGLGITFNRLRAIESNRKEVDEMLMDMIAAWLEIESETQPEPTWRKLCEAVGKINRGRAEVIAQEHQCDCSDCLGIATLVTFFTCTLLLIDENKIDVYLVQLITYFTKGGMFFDTSLVPRLP